MLPGSLLAIPDAVTAGGALAAPPLGPAPPRVLVEGGESRAARWGRIVPSALVSLIVHGLVVAGFLVIWHAMLEPLSAPDPISVEIVHSVPGEDVKAAPAPAPAKPAEPPKAEPPKPDPLKQALPAPVAPLPPPAAAASPSAPAPAPTPAPPDPGPAPVTPETQPERPTPPISSDQKGALVEPPPEPKAAATQAEADAKPNAAPDPAKSPAPDETVKPEVPPVLAAPEADAVVPAPLQPPDPAKPPRTSDPDQATSKAAAAHLAAALPTSTMPMPLSFRAMLSSSGTSESQEYKGLVFGAVSRLVQNVEGEARQRRLKGVVVLAITLGPTGAVDKVTVVQSSGQAAVDSFAVDMIRKAAFPPPPPGSARTFTPAIAFGDADG